MEFTWILIILALILAAYVWGTWTFKHFDNLNIPHDKPLPFLGNMLPFITGEKSFGDIIEDAYKKHKGSGLIGAYQFRTPVIIVFDTEVIKSVAVKDFDHFTDHYTALGEDDDPLLGKFLFALKGDRWKFMRNALSPAFTSSKMKSMFHLVADCGTQLGDYLEKKCRENGGVVTTDMKDLYTRYGNDVIATCAFGIQCDSLNQPDNEFYLVGKKTANFGSGKQIIKMFGYILFPFLMRLFKVQVTPKKAYTFFHDIAHSTIAQREKGNIIRPDMIHLLMEAKKGMLKAESHEELEGEVKHEVKRTVLSDADITAQAFLFFLAGFDTTSTNLCFISHLLATHPEALQRIQDEIDSVLEEGNGTITYEGLNRMKYTEMVISESLRLWPPGIATDRVCVKPYTIPATKSNPRVHLKVGDVISIPMLPIHRDPEYFETPLEFIPERFSDENKHKIKPYTYMPFGAGPRICIGMRFAMMETKIALASILSRFDLKVVSKTQKQLVFVKNSMLVNVEGGFWLGFAPRTKARASISSRGT